MVSLLINAGGSDREGDLHIKVITGGISKTRAGVSNWLRFNSSARAGYPYGPPTLLPQRIGFFLVLLGRHQQKGYCDRGAGSHFEVEIKKLSIATAKSFLHKISTCSDVRER